MLKIQDCIIHFLHSCIQQNEENIDTEHICCAISDKKWLEQQIAKGYIFKKFNVNHKVFIEYCPSEIAWLPITAPNYHEILNETKFNKVIDAIKNGIYN